MNPKVFDIFLSILDTGEMKTNKGDSVSFKNAMILFTTNLGYSSGYSKDGLGFVNTSSVKEDILEAVKKHFRPEFINRIDDIIVFNSLDDSIAERLIERYKKEYEASSGLKFELDEKDIEEIKTEADIPEYGARGLKRAVRKQLLKVANK